MGTEINFPCQMPADISHFCFNPIEEHMLDSLLEGRQDVSKTTPVWPTLDAEPPESFVNLMQRTYSPDISDVAVRLLYRDSLFVYMVRILSLSSVIFNSLWGPAQTPSRSPKRCPLHRPQHSSWSFLPLPYQDLRSLILTTQGP